ncbi:MAG: DNA-binding protein [Alphaproteobacteria bacterium]
MAIQNIPIIGVMGSHRNEWPELTQPLGAWIATQGCHLLTGGGSGVMTSTARAFCAVAIRAGRSIGILPTDENPPGIYTPRPGYPNPWIEIPIITPLSFGEGGTVSRNHVNILSSDAVVALPGNNGTIDEVTLALRFGKPLLCYGVKDDFSGFPTGCAHTDSFDTVTRFLHDHIGQILSRRRKHQGSGILAS